MGHMDNWLLYILVVIAIGIGWWLRGRERIKQAETLGPNYYNGVNYLLNEEPDRAVAAFIEELEVNQETLETHLALGGLLRRRGELEKAVIVHENILAHARLEKEDMLNVKLELARDYLLAGLLDRAEELSITLSSEKGETLRESRKITLEVYEMEKEWQQAAEVAQLLAVGDDTEKYEKAISHYYCEIATDHLGDGDYDKARESISKAIGHDANNARATLIHGKIDIAEGRYEDAINTLKRIRDQEPVYVPESLDSLVEVYEKADLPTDDFCEYLESCLEITPSISIVLTLATVKREQIGDEAMAKFIANHLKRNPTIRGLTQLIDLHVDNTSGVAKQNLTILRSFAEALVADKPAYRCHACGFELKKMAWHCPSCRDWATVKPIFGLEGE
ncbi:MAG TPA: lipopolysaccharide assembly protein LapB [Gammaproteobacteria bacterium]|nr:lipopolysaccharide assembly protein LapB [Gammaproteobacteria bacterium]|tara:strand:+ start:565 stop:1740 length:1176 start_codon:yes stop_codon:yes gene_type:complete